MKRTFSHAKEHPMKGDVVEIRERRIDDCDDEEYDSETMLRVLAVHESFVWVKVYGEGRHTWHLSRWKKRLGEAQVGTLIRGGDYDAPF